MRKRRPVVLGSFIVIAAAIALRSAGASANGDRGETAQPESARWVNIGPSPLTFVLTPTDPANFESSGRVATIAVHPTDPRRWLIGAGNGGVWESRDAGTSWVRLTDAAPTLAIGAVAFAPSNPNVIYAATGEAASVGFAKAGLGMLKSTDGGGSWDLVGGFHLARASVRRVRIHPTNSNVLLVAASRGGFGRDSQEGAPQPVLAPPRYGILKSTDGGLTWVRTLAGVATALETDASFNRQYAAIGDQRLGVLTDSSDSAGNGVYRSMNAGENWSRVDGPWGTDTAPTNSKVGRIELAMSPSNPNVLYASIQLPPNGGSSATGLLGLYRTDNAWDPSPTWIQIRTDETGLDGYCGPTNCGYSHVISVDPGNPTTLIAGGAEQGLWRCTNCGASPVWANITLNSGVHPDHHALAWAGARLIDGNDGGVWSTTDVGGSWQNHNRTLSTALFFSGSLHPTDPNAILGGIRGFQASIRGAAFRGDDSVWTVLPRIASVEWGDGEVVLSSQRPDTDWMIAGTFGAIQRTTDGGVSGIRADVGIGDKTGAAFVAPVRKCPTNDEVFVTGTNRMWRTDNFFSAVQPSWVSNGPAHSFPSPNALGAPGTILAIAFAPSDPPCRIYAAGNRGGEIQLTRNGGGAWTDLDALRTLPARPVNGLAFDPTNPNTLYVALSSFDDATFDRPGHVFKTVDAFAAAPTWVDVSPPIDVPFNVITVDPRDPDLVYAGSDTGLWRSSDGADTWVRMGPETGLPNVAIHDIQINPATDTTVVFTYGRGAFVLTTEEATLRPPTDLRVTSVVDNTVTIAFTAASDSITPTGYVLEGGVSPGEVLASIPTESTTTTFTFTAPTGAFYIRVHAVAGSTRSQASNEIRIVVNQPPSTPANLLALVNGSSVALAWMNTFAGGAPSRLIVDVTGSLTAALSLPVTESFAVAGVPPGTYTVALRAANGGGASGASNSVTVTVPGACSGTPGTPPDFVATKSANVIAVAWGLPVSGPAPTGYTIVVTGSFVGTIPVSSRTASGAVGPGSYTISVVATNPCGSSGATPPQTVTIP